MNKRKNKEKRGNGECGRKNNKALKSFSPFLHLLLPLSLNAFYNFLYLNK